MLASVVWLPGKVLGVLAVGALVAHWIALAELPPLEPRNGLEALTALSMAFVAGRILLALLPPGSIGGHSPAELASTVAVSVLLVAMVAPAWSSIGAWGLCLLLVAGIARLLTLPGAMVPRHRVASEVRPWLHVLMALALSTWTVLGGNTAAQIALVLCVFHVLGVARRAPFGRHAVLALGATCAFDTDDVPLAIVSLGLGACFLVPWLRRADRRAGALAGLAFGSLFQSGFGPLPIAASALYVAASHPRQRRFTVTWVGSAGLVCLLASWLTPDTDYLFQYGSFTTQIARGRQLLPWVLYERALEPEFWGLAWPIVLGALALGTLAFPWKAQPWEPGTIESPRREVLAVGTLLVLSAVALALPWSPWFEEDVLRILFAPAALLAGLLLIPAERVRAA